MERVLVTGACGQLGSELSMALAQKYGTGNVIVSDISPAVPLIAELPYEQLDVLDRNRLQEIVNDHQITRIYHLAALLSAKGEQNPQFAWQLNMDGLINVLEVARQSRLSRLFWPSSIAAFGAHTENVDTPQYAVMDPNTIYGISKLSGELWCNYYHQKYQLDVRSVRYPGLISYKAPPGGGTTDYAIEIFHSAIKGETFKCFLEKDTHLPMMYMPDAVKAAVDLMEAADSKLTIRTSYNIGAVNFTPQEIFEEIQSHFPDFEISYQPDYRQQIAATWPRSLDDRTAQTDWGWQSAFDLSKMTSDMISNLSLSISQ
jgi:nucleoside-diphosphate-sugar epimerase